MKINQQGFTLIELLVVIAIMAVLLATSVAGFRGYARYQEYDAAVAGTLTALNAARAEARAANFNSAHGVKFTSNSVTTFVGTIYNAGASTNEVLSFPNVVITTSLAGGVSELYFSPVTGLPNVTGTVMIVGNAHEATTTITINGAGVIQ
jgi:prepilin-type N-terminal cleavage/methylation domain-containing protein